MPRKEQKINLGQRIAALQHAEASHGRGREKAVFGGRRLVLPGMAGREINHTDHTPQHLSPTGTWAIPLLDAQEQTDPSLTWAHWSVVDASNTSKNNNESENTIPRQFGTERDRVNPQKPAGMHSHAKRDLERDSHELVNAKSATSSELNLFMNNLLVGQSSSETSSDNVLRENRSPRSEIESVSASASANQKQQLERANQGSHYQHRSARGRLGIDERIDVFEPRQISSTQEFKTLENFHPRRIPTDDDESTLATHTSPNGGRKLAQPVHIDETQIPKTTSAWRKRLVPFRRTKSETSVSLSISDTGSHSSQHTDRTMSAHHHQNLHGRQHAQRSGTAASLQSPRPSNVIHMTKLESWSASSRNRLNSDTSQLKRSQADSLFPIPNESHRQLQVHLFEPDPTRVAGKQTQSRTTTTTNGSIPLVNGHTIHTLSTPKIGNASTQTGSRTKHLNRHFDNRIEPSGISNDLSSSGLTRIRLEQPGIVRANNPTDARRPVSPNAEKATPGLRLTEPMKPTLQSRPRPQRDDQHMLHPISKSISQYGCGIRRQTSMSSDGDFNENLKHDAFAVFDDEEEIENPFERGEPALKYEVSTSLISDTATNIIRASNSQQRYHSSPSQRPTNEISDIRVTARGQGVTCADVTSSRNIAPARRKDASGKPSTRLARLKPEELEFNVGCDVIHARDRSSTPTRTKPHGTKESEYSEYATSMREDVVDAESHTPANVRSNGNSERLLNACKGGEFAVPNLSPSVSRRYSRAAEFSKFDADNASMKNPFRESEYRGLKTHPNVIKSNTIDNDFRGINRVKDVVQISPDAATVASAAANARKCWEPFDNKRFSIKDQRCSPVGKSRNEQYNKRRSPDVSDDKEPESEAQAIDRLLAALDMMTTGATQSIPENRHLSLTRLDRCESRAPVVAVSEATGNVNKDQALAQEFVRDGPHVDTASALGRYHGQSAKEAQIVNDIQNVGQRQVTFVQGSPKALMTKTKGHESLEQRPYASASIRKYWRDYSNVRSRGSFDSVSLASSKVDAKTLVSVREYSFDDDLSMISERNVLDRDTETRNAVAQKVMTKDTDHPLSDEQMVAISQGISFEPKDFASRENSASMSVDNATDSTLAYTRENTGGEATRRTRHSQRSASKNENSFERLEKAEHNKPGSQQCERLGNCSSRHPWEYTRAYDGQQGVQHLPFYSQPLDYRNGLSNDEIEKTQVPLIPPPPPPPLPPPEGTDISLYNDEAESVAKPERTTNDSRIVKQMPFKDSKIPSQCQMRSDVSFGNSRYSFPLQGNSKCLGKGLDPPGENVADNLISSPCHIPPQHLLAATASFGHNTEGDLNSQHEILPEDSFDSDNAIVEDIVELLSTTSSGNSENGHAGAIDFTSLRRSCSIDSTLAIQAQEMPILPPRALEKEVKSPLTAAVDSFDSLNFEDRPNEDKKGHSDAATRALPPVRQRNGYLPSPSVYSRQLASPLRDSLIHAMSPMLSEDTDDDSASDASSQNKTEDDKARGGFRSCAFLFESIDLSKIQEKIESLCRF